MSLGVSLLALSVGRSVQAADSSLQGRTRAVATQAATGFVDVTEAAGLSTTPTKTFGNPIWGDLDGDGFLDLFISRHFSGYSLYRNHRDGTFRRMQILDFESPNTDLHSGAFGDFDNDGSLDLYVFYGAKGGQTLGVKSDQLYVFSRARGAVNVLPLVGADQNADGRAQSVSLVDLENDGFLDVFVMNREGANKFYHNEGGMGATDIAPLLGLDDPAGALGEYSAWADYDRDGDMDLLLARQELRLARNDGGVLTDVTDDARLPRFQFTEGIAWGDYDNDLWPDLLLTRCGSAGETPTTRLFRNIGDGTFQDVTDQAGLVREDKHHHVGIWGDYDNDGHLDLFLVNSRERGSLAFNGVDTLYRSNGDGTFSDVSAAEGINVLVLGSGDGAAWGDYDNDGFLDLVVTNGKIWGTRYLRGRDILYRNLGNAHHWVKVVPRGTASNAAGIGARVMVTAAGRTQVRELVGGGGGKLRSQGHGPLHFGLGDAQLIDTLVIEWPGGGKETYENLAVDQTILAIEGQGLDFEAAGFPGPGRD